MSVEQREHLVRAVLRSTGLLVWTRARCELGPPLAPGSGGGGGGGVSVSAASSRCYYRLARLTRGAERPQTRDPRRHRTPGGLRGHIWSAWRATRRAGAPGDQPTLGPLRHPNMVRGKPPRESCEVASRSAWRTFLRVMTGRGGAGGSGGRGGSGGLGRLGVCGVYKHPDGRALLSAATNCGYLVL